MAENECAVCGKLSKQNCGQCGLVYYCSREHQVEDWKKSHKTNCISYKIETNQKLGRHVKAIKDIDAGDVVLKKKPLVLAPKTVSHYICLGCHKKMENPHDYSCSKCSWPLCCLLCEESKHHQDECEIMSKHQYKPVFKDGPKQTCYAIIGPLRALLLKKTSKEKFKSLLDFQDHLDKQKQTQVYTILKSTLVPALLKYLEIESNEEEILRICSIFDTNAFEVRDSKRVVNVRGLYPSASLISHDCTTNTRHIFVGEEFEICFLSTVPIKKGEIITTSYTQTLWGTMARQLHLKNTKQFDCTCKRCSDPTELGTYVASIYCSTCRETNKSNCCPKMVSKNPLNKDSEWECEQCGKTISAKQYSCGNEALRSEILRLDKTKPEKFEEFLEKYSNVLHPTNSHVLEVKYALSQMHGNMEGYSLSDDQIQRKIDVCKELLELSEILEPGLSRFRGSILYDLHAAIVFQAKAEFTKGKINEETASEMMQDAINVLFESAKILSVESDMKEMLRVRLENISKFLLD